MPRLNIPSPEAIRHQQEKRRPVAENRLYAPRPEDDYPFLRPSADPQPPQATSFTIDLC